ncbi:MAG TPA: DUF721 domain-containing protein [Deltaproteobacteria bacterium]|nr:DUF721 domain-containing protein [Deltaproteobacteria bacterium]
MRRIGDVLANQNRQIGQVMKIRAQWTDIAGEVLAAHTDPVAIKHKVLQVLCDSPAWAQQVGLLSRTIEEQVRKITRVKIEKIEGRFGMARKAPPRKRTVQAIGRPDIDPRDIDKIRDPKLARVVRELATGEGNGDG